MTFALVAEFPLGTYRGHVGSSTVDLYPSVARLHAALLCAAGSGLRARADGEQLVPREADRAALEWIEANPPDGVVLPQCAPGSRRSAPDVVAFRETGLIGTRDKKKVYTKCSRKINVPVAADGGFAWVWDALPPSDVVEALAELCADVSHLGTSESPVRMRIEDLAATYRRDDTAELFSGSGLDVEVPMRGRTDELLDQHRQALSRPPTAARDRCKSNEKDVSASPCRAAVGVARYRLLAPEPESSPWSQVFLLPLDHKIDVDWRVRWAVCAHRALVALVGQDAPATVTGVYPEGATRPANRIAIQFLGQELLAKGKLNTPSTLAVLVPAGAITTDVDVAADALERLQVVRGPGGRVARRAGALTLADASRFWPLPPVGRARRWLTVPAAVPDGRPPRRGQWSMADAVALSAGLVWRDVLVGPGKGARWQVALADNAKDRGVTVEWLNLVTTGDVTRFVHRVNSGVVVRPYNAVIDLGDLAGPQALIALGQSRHLGGGLLRPIDGIVPQESRS